MPEFCTCGARLPEDARFCHKCGKDQREPLPVDAAEIEPPPLPPPAPAIEPPPIGFHNRVAVWIALRVGVMAFLLSMFSGVFSIVFLVGGGFLSVYLYGRRTGQRLSVLSGAHLGWIVGIFGFVLSTIFVTVFIASLNQPEVLEAVKVQIEKGLAQAGASSQMDPAKALELIRSPIGVGSILVMSFGLLTLLPAFGGAIGAKLLGRR